MGNFAGVYTYRQVHIVAEIKAYQGNKVGSNNWMKNIHNRIKDLDSAGTDDVIRVRLERIDTTDKELNSLLEKIEGDIKVTDIEFPLYDVPPMPRCTGNFNQYTGLITHDTECELDVHKKGVIV